MSTSSYTAKSQRAPAGTPETEELSHLREQNERLKQQLEEREEIMQSLFSYLTEQKSESGRK